MVVGALSLTSVSCMFLLIKRSCEPVASPEEFVGWMERTAAETELVVFVTKDVPPLCGSATHIAGVRYAEAGVELTRSDGHGMVRSIRCRWSSENPGLP